jgi:hypothetical protein
MNYKNMGFQNLTGKQKLTVFVFMDNGELIHREDSKFKYEYKRFI